MEYLLDVPMWVVDLLAPMLDTPEYSVEAMHMRSQAAAALEGLLHLVVNLKSEIHGGGRVAGGYHGSRRWGRNA